MEVLNYGFFLVLDGVWWKKIKISEEKSCWGNRNLESLDDLFKVI